MFESVSKFFYDWYKFFYVALCGKEKFELRPLDPREKIFDKCDIDQLNRIYHYGRVKQGYYEKLR